MNDIYTVTRQFFRNYLRNGQTVVPQQPGKLLSSAFGIEQQFPEPLP